MDIAKHWKTIVDTIQDGLMVMDTNGNILAMNSAAERLTGYAAGELVGTNCRTLNCTGCKIFGRGSGKLWCSLFADGAVKNKKCLITNKAQRGVHVLKNAAVLRDTDGCSIGAVETFTDMSVIIQQQAEIDSLRRSCHLDDGFHGIIGESQIMQQLFEVIDNVAPSDTPVLIAGQSGTGKELVARAIHETSARKTKPFIKVNCAALNENILESELFGHEKGAYTGADRTRIGRFEAAHEGTIFLDEIGDIPLSTQVKLLRVLEEKEIERVGDHKPIPVDVRVISASNKELDELVAHKLFREDLLFRINVFPISCPPLSQRTEDIPLMVQSFIEENVDKGTKKISGLTPEALEALLTYPWPGNVRELRNAIEYAFVLCPAGWIGLEHLPPKIACPDKTQKTNHRPIPATWQQERENLIDTLRKAGGNQSEAARLLGVSRITIWKRIKKYEINLATDVGGIGRLPAADSRNH